MHFSCQLNICPMHNLGGGWWEDIIKIENISSNDNYIWVIYILNYIWVIYILIISVVMRAFLLPQVSKPRVACLCMWLKGKGGQKLRL